MIGIINKLNEQERIMKVEKSDYQSLTYYFDFFDNNIDHVEKILGNYMQAISTDFAISLGCHIYHNKIGIHNFHDKLGWYWVTVNRDNNLCYEPNYNSVFANIVYELGIRPQTIYKEKNILMKKICYNPQDNLSPVGFRPFLFIKCEGNTDTFDIPYNPGSEIKLVDDFLKIQYGFYPQQSPLIQVELETLYQMGIIKETEYKNRISCYDYLLHRSEMAGYDDQADILTMLRNRIASEIPINPLLLKKYEYKGKRYTRVFAKPEKEILLSNGYLCQMNKAVWLEDMPVEWYVKRINKNLIMLFSERIILPPMEHQNKVNVRNGFKDGVVIYDGFKFMEVDIIKFLNTEFAQEIIQSMDHVDYFNYDEVKKELEHNQLVKK